LSRWSAVPFKTLHTLESRSGVPSAALAGLVGIPRTHSGAASVEGKFTTEESSACCGWERCSSRQWNCLREITRGRVALVDRASKIPGREDTSRLCAHGVRSAGGGKDLIGRLEYGSFLECSVLSVTAWRIVKQKYPASKAFDGEAPVCMAGAGTLGGCPFVYTAQVAIPGRAWRCCCTSMRRTCCRATFSLR